jgi:hypothetical protein
MEDAPHLVISSWVSQNEQTGLIEWSLKLVGKCTRSVPSSNCISTSVLSKFQDSPLSIRPCGLHNDVFRVFNSNNNPGSQLKLFPRFPKVDNVNTWESPQRQSSKNVNAVQKLIFMTKQKQTRLHGIPLYHYQTYRKLLFITTLANYQICCSIKHKTEWYTT